jgi:hypothetical protein
MRRTHLACFIVLALFALREARAALPVPPNQRTPWNPPSTSTIPNYVIKVADQLFNAGFADPRGGVYRKVEVFSHHFDQRITQTHAWVFPGDFAVCWNGMVYRVKTAGDAADLEADVQAILATKPWGGRMLASIRSGDDSDPAAFWANMQTQPIVPASIALLLRLGRADLADKLWVARDQPTLTWDQAHLHEREEGLWLTTAGTAWFAAAYWRFVFAFGAADDFDSADVGESILEWRSRMPNAWQTENRWLSNPVSDISFLTPVPEIAADARRRLKEPRRQNIDLKAIADDKNGTGEFFHQTQAVRLAQLTDRLEDVVGSKITIPGSLMFSFDPVYQLLVREGGAAVPALIDAYENDHRLTRTFDYSRPWSIEYKPIAVRHVVELLLGDLLGDSAWSGKSPAELRSWWHDRQSTTRAERSFETLADDHATPEQWTESADFLATRSDLQRSGHGWSTLQPGACDPGATPAPPNGEPLRSRTKPSVTELMQKRVAAFANQGSELACSMAIKLALWDQKGALSSLRLAAKLQSCRANPQVAVARLSLGDANAASDWTAELPHHAKFPPLAQQELAPLWMFPEDPVLDQAAQALFGDANSQLSPIKSAMSINSPLMAIPAFRRAVLSALQDPTIAARFTQRANGYIQFAFDKGSVSFPDRVDSRSAKDAVPPARAQDMVAWGMSSIDGAPEFGLDWTTAAKDAALPAIRSFIEKNGPDMQPFPSRLAEMDCGGRIALKPVAK